ncbi:cytochrome P450 [Amylostereum chailletii]|nr:cytochrome P450 [Amylostereum chailletii]
MTLGEASLPPLSVLLGLLGASLVLIRWYNLSGLNAIPTVGYSDPILSYITAFRFLFHADELILEGYSKLTSAKYKPGVFKIAHFDGWRVIVAGRGLIEDIGKAPDDVLSFDEATRRLLQVEHTLGPEIQHNPYHVHIVRAQLTRNIASTLPVIQDELSVAFDDLIPSAGNDWVGVDTKSAILKVVCRVTNRVFVGLPLCRDEGFQALNIECATNVVVAGKLINMFPEILHPIVAHFLTRLSKQTHRQMRYLAPVVKDRERMLAEYGADWGEKPNDMLTWLMETATGEERSLKNLSRRIIAVNFAAIHTSSLSFTHALYHLAAGPEYVNPLRKEIETVVAAEGWTKAAMVKMRKLDSFLRESQRFNGLGFATMSRLTLKPFTLSNGITIPKGTILSCAEAATHHDEGNYEDAKVFKPFRFSDTREEDGEAAKHQMISTGSNYIAFGHGRHACPGRFFAANELKCMLAHVVVNYDVNFEDGVNGVPAKSKFDVASIPANVRLLFRKRKT